MHARSPAPARPARRSRQCASTRARTAVLVVTLTCACTGTAPADQVTTVASNGAFAPDSAALLVAASERRAGAGPWYSDPQARDWQVVFSTAPPDDPGALSEVARFDDRSPQQGGGILSASLWWLPQHDLALALEYHQATLYPLDGGAPRALTLPPAQAQALFTDDLPVDLRDYAGPITLAPSPDGDRIAVHHQAAILGDGGLDDMRFYHAVAFHTPDGSLIATSPLRPFRGGEHQLRRAGPPPPHDNPEPPAHQPLRAVPALDVVSFVWTPDSQAVVFVGRRVSDAQLIALRVDADTGSTEQVDAVPAVGLPSPGGPVSAGGAFLSIHEPEGAPDLATLQLHHDDAHVPFGSDDDVPPDAIGFTW